MRLTKYAVVIQPTDYPPHTWLKQMGNDIIHLHLTDAWIVWPGVPAGLTRLIGSPYSTPISSLVHVSLRF